MGIAPDKLKNILNPDFGDSSHLGLNNVNRRLKLTFGNEYGISISSIPCIQTSVLIEIPYISPSQQQKEIENMNNILIVDDEYLSRNKLSGIVDYKKYGFNVIGEVSNGKEAVEFIKSNPVDVVLRMLPCLKWMELSLQSTSA